MTRLRGFAAPAPHVRRMFAWMVVTAAVCASAPAADGYLKLGTRIATGIANLRFTRFPIRYFVTNRDVPGVTAPQLQQAVERGFASWAAIPNTGLSSQFVGFTGALVTGVWVGYDDSRAGPISIAFSDRRRSTSTR